MRVLIHPDGGTNIGLGHASRCSAIANALIRLGHEIRVLVEPESRLAEYLSRFQLPVIEGLTSSAGIQAQADQFIADLIVVDSYRWVEADFKAIRCRGRFIVAFDDTARIRLPIDAVINGAPGAVNLQYQSLAETRLWLGPAYQVLRDEFLGLPMRKLADTVKNLIVLLGGDDPLSLMAQLAPRLNVIAGEMRPSFQVEIICGPYAQMPNTDGLVHVKVSRHPVNLRERMQAADLALSASGQTLYELASCGTPTIAFCTGEDQANNLTALSKAGVTWDTGQANSPKWIANVEDAIRIISADYDRRQQMSTLAQSLIDGRGADRLADKLQNLVASPIAN
jgi:UDP-2,4-diacetamido-2,4,6-trideoxy-beta-L-altropyranose hydrolase